MQPTPPPLPPRPAPPSIPPPEPTAEETLDSSEFEGELSEKELRELYDDEEIDRFLSLFSAYVTEVYLPDDTQTSLNRGATTNLASLSPTESEGSDWATIDGSEFSRPSSPLSTVTRGLSEEIAFRYLLPLLPASAPPIPLFTLGRLRLTTQRIYLAVQPVYAPLFVSLANLATWKDKRRSSLYCTVFWVLWYYNLLLPFLFFRLFFSLVRRKLFSYPTLAELRSHRQEVDRAKEFGQDISARLSASSTFGMKELWRLFRVLNKPQKAKSRNISADKARDVEGEQRDDKRELNTVLDSEDPQETPQEKDFKRAFLNTLNEIADLHERIKNIFIWRRPASSRVYGMVLLLLLIVTLVIPAKYLAKLTYFVGGLFFWHVTPVIAALPPIDRSRLPPAFGDVPTDTEYAMELISQRVAAGLDVRPVGSTRVKNRGQQGASAESSDIKRQERQKQDKDVDWKKWGERAALGMSWAEDGKRIFTAGQWPKHDPNRATGASAAGSSSIQTHTFPAQHTSAPGLITLTPDRFFFTPLMSSHAKIEIPLPSLRGVKRKSNIFTALSIRWVDVEGDVKEEKFRWVGGRDELFARLVGTADGKRWIKS
ncbi:hypothetical protein C8J57DRAFT_1269369 [Mycena rebaudengoi]|nr:hypothetical protein C8J57DRAFT_1269369 [Mycena rebaudengoi]